MGNDLAAYERVYNAFLYFGPPACLIELKKKAAVPKAVMGAVVLVGCLWTAKDDIKPKSHVQRLGTPKEPTGPHVATTP